MHGQEPLSVAASNLPRCTGGACDPAPLGKNFLSYHGARFARKKPAILTLEIYLGVDLDGRL